MARNGEAARTAGVKELTIRGIILGALITVPAGWTFAIAEAEYRGRARLYAGATAVDPRIADRTSPEFKHS